MNGEIKKLSRSARSWPQIAGALVLTAWWVGAAGAQSPPPLPFPAAPNGSGVVRAGPTLPAGPADHGVIPASCHGCGPGSALPPMGPGGCGGCDASGCIPGRTNPCYSCEGNDSCLGRLCGDLYRGVCCPDPCYEPRWIAVANAAFFVDGARPITHTRIRYDAGINFQLPDRQKYFWARTGGSSKGPAGIETGLNHHDLRLYNEVGSGKAGVFSEIPYRSIDPDVNNHASGFSDIIVGTKAMLVDCELLELTFQFSTHLPVGNYRRGLGTGHVSLEPSLVAAVKLHQDTYLQAQLSEWIPIAADQNFAGSVLHYHFALNHVLVRILPDVPLIATLEFSGYSFQDGLYTDPGLRQPLRASRQTYAFVGPGIRLVICDKVDIGFGTQFGIGNPGGPDQFYRTEFRWRF